MAQASVRSEDIVCPGGMPAFLARPDRPGTFPVVVLMHERYGLVKHSKDLALRARERRRAGAGAEFLLQAPGSEDAERGQLALRPVRSGSRCS